MTEALKPRRVLVVDDNRDNADTMAMFLRLIGHDVQTAYDGEKALESARVMRPEVMLLDIGLPKLNGYEVAEAVRSWDWGDRPVLAAVTGYGGETVVRQCRQAGFDHHLLKPIDVQDLYAVLEAG